MCLAFTYFYIRQHDRLRAGHQIGSKILRKPQADRRTYSCDDRTCCFSTFLPCFPVMYDPNDHADAHNPYDQYTAQLVQQDKIPCLRKQQTGCYGRQYKNTENDLKFFIPGLPMMTSSFRAFVFPLS